MLDNKQNGMMTKVWGPPGWFFLHAVTFGYPDEINPENVDRVRHYANFFNSLGHVLPCKYCRNSYNEYISELPVENFLQSRKDLTSWLYLIHNKVNDKLGIPECVTFEEVENKYEQYRAKCKQTTDKERSDRLIKGCTVPENGKKKKCLVSIVNDVETFEDSSPPFLLNCSLALIIIILLIVVSYLK